MQRDFTQALETFKNFCAELRIKFFLLRDIGMHRGNTKRFCGLAVLDAIQPKRQKPDEASQRQRKVKMRSHLARSCFQIQTDRRCDGDDVCERNNKGQASYTCEFGNLNKRPCVVQRNAKPDPANKPTPKRKVNAEVNG